MGGVVLSQPVLDPFAERTDDLQERERDFTHSRDNLDSISERTVSVSVLAFESVGAKTKAGSEDLFHRASPSWRVRVRRLVAWRPHQAV